MFKFNKEQKNITRILEKRRKNFKRIISAIIFLVISYIFGFGDYGIYQYYQLRQEENRLSLDLEQLKTETDRLDTELSLARKKDSAYFQRTAREKFGLVKPGEKIYILTPISKNR
ncbi:septum formation initiator family protein [candidate division KSB1 bacterium]|nr:septum formation initiator family protein [candidate division KSB1 bacterium]